MCLHLHIHQRLLHMHHFLLFWTHFHNNLLFKNLLKVVVELELFLTEEPYPALTIHSPALTVPSPVNKFPNKDAPKVSNSIDKKPPFRSFVSFLIGLVTPFNKIFESSKA